MARHFSKARLAELLGVSKQLLQHHTRGALAKACSEAGVDIDHPDAIAWLLARYDVTPNDVVARDGGAPRKMMGRPASAPTRTTELPSSATTSPPSTAATRDQASDAAQAPSTTSNPTTGSGSVPLLPDARDPVDTEQLLRLSFAEIVARWGHLEGFEGWLDARKRLAEIHRIELQNAQTQGLLISRSLVVRMFGYWNGCNTRLLTDTAQTLAVHTHDACKNGEPVETIVALIRTEISQHLKAARDEATRALRERRPEEAAET